jgi:hypothetical protein
MLEKIQELVLSDKPVDTEASFEKRPDMRVSFSMREAPTGPSADLKELSVIDNPSVPRKVDRVVSDTDYRAAPGVAELFGGGISQRQITRLFSVGMLGVKDSRRLVPTAWSITAVDDIIGKSMADRVKYNPTIDEYRIYRAEALANNVVILLTPTPWMFENLELWHASAPNYRVDADFELYEGRKDYASNTAGAYYAARAPVLEYLDSTGRQAGAIAFLEVQDRRGLCRSGGIGLDARGAAWLLPRVGRSGSRAKAGDDKRDEQEGECKTARAGGEHRTSFEPGHCTGIHGRHGGRPHYSRRPHYSCQHGGRPHYSVGQANH